MCVSYLLRHTLRKLRLRFARGREASDDRVARVDLNSLRAGRGDASRLAPVQHAGAVRACGGSSGGVPDSTIAIIRRTEDDSWPTMIAGELTKREERRTYAVEGKVGEAEGCRGRVNRTSFTPATASLNQA